MHFTRKYSNPMELTNALALDYLDPALEGHIITFTCPTGQIFNESKLTQQPVWGMENGNQTLES